MPVADIDAVDAGNFLTTSNLIVNDTAENVIECAGNVLCSKITATDGLSFGSNIELADTAANVLILNGNLVAGNASTANEQRHVIYGNLYVEGNVVVTDVSKSFVQENLAVSNAIIEVGAGQTTAVVDERLLNAAFPVTRTTSACVESRIWTFEPTLRRSPTETFPA